MVVRRLRSAGLTLVELMVSIALMMILTGSIVFVFIQAQNIFTHVVAKVEVYQNARIALDQMERDLANVVLTADMEFFNDTNTPPLGHYFDKGTNGPMAIPIVGAEDKPGQLYNYAMTVRQPQPFIGLDGRSYRHDSIYFKTITMINDPVQGEQTTAALVEYALADTNRERPKLTRRIWHVTGYDNSGGAPKLVINNAKTSAQPETSDMCYYVMNIEFSIYMENKRTGVGSGYYSPKDANQPKRIQPSNTFPFPPEPSFWNDPDCEIQTFYHASHDHRDNDPDWAIMEKDDDGKFHTKRDFLFPMLKPGDKIFLWEPVDSPTYPQDPAQGTVFPMGDYTIKRFIDNYNNTGMSRIELLEPIAFATLGPISGGNVTPRTINLKYRAPWLPPAVRCVMKIKDSKAKELRTISRTFKVLSS
jgi:type II secretory pathway pseudopilin PulG